MAYTVRHQKRDGSVEIFTREFRGDGHIDKYPCNPISGRTAAEARKNIAETLKHTRRNLRNKKGFSKDGNSRLVAQIPEEVITHVRRQDGPDAARDTRYCLRVAEHLGIDCRVSRGRF
jgi:hypothetical protein